MKPSVFVSMSDRKMASLIAAASQRVAVAVPAVRKDTAKALLNAIERLGDVKVNIVIDCDEEVFRLGYGDFNDLIALRMAGCSVRHSSGLRIGVLVCDAKAWVFAPTALYVQAEIHSDETPNAVSLRSDDVEQVFSRISTSIPRDEPTLQSNAQTQESSQAAVEIGNDGISQGLFDQTQAALELAPPVAFNLARQVRVFEPYIQYVEISLRGCAIERHRIEVPKSFQGIMPNAELDSRLRTTFDLVEKSGEVSAKSIEEKLNEIRKDFTRPLGEPWGRVLLRSVRPKFDREIETVRERLRQHQERVEVSLEMHLSESHEQLIRYYLPLVRNAPPNALMGQVTTSKPSDDLIRSWLNAELARVFPKPADLIKDMTLDVQFRDVTYETLKEDGFAEKLRDAYPHVDWDKPFNEFEAARERDFEAENHGQ